MGKIKELKKYLKDKFPELEEKVMDNKKLDSGEVETILQFVETTILEREESKADADAGSDSKKN